MYTVKFIGFDGKIEKEERVEKGKDATAPDLPNVDAHRFIKWDKDFTNVTSKLTVTAIYEGIPYYKVTFLGKDGDVLDIQTVKEGDFATAPNVPNVDGYKFLSWDSTFEVVNKDISVKAVYGKLYQVEILNYKDEVVYTYEGLMGDPITYPEPIVHEDGNYTFVKWSESITEIKGDLTIRALYSYNGNDFQFVKDSLGYSTSKGTGYYKYVGTGKEILAIPYSIDGDIITSYYGMFSENTDTTLKKVIGSTTPTSVRFMFWKSTYTEMDVSSIDTSEASNMVGTFHTSKIGSLIGLEKWDTSKVNNMSAMFYKSKIDSLNLSKFVTSNVTDMSNMFTESEAKTIDLSSFDTSNVTKMNSTCSSYSNCSGYGMFEDSKAHTIILGKKFTTTKANSLSGMFKNSSATRIEGLTYLTIPSDSNLISMFSGSHVETIDLSSLELKYSTNEINSMLSGAKATSVLVKNENSKSNILNYSNYPGGKNAIVVKK